MCGTVELGRESVDSPDFSRDVFVRVVQGVGYPYQ